VIDLEKAFQQAAEAILAADALLIGAGAGMGVDSGPPRRPRPQRSRAVTSPLSFRIVSLHRSIRPGRATRPENESLFSRPQHIWLLEKNDRRNKNNTGCRGKVPIIPCRI
jgi:hypothetical protein